MFLLDIGLIFSASAGLGTHIKPIVQQIGQNVLNKFDTTYDSQTWNLSQRLDGQYLKPFFLPKKCVN